MAEIHVLDKHTAELIAAGEVVERPASVAKELLENAIDAGAGKIDLRIERGGISLIEVSDNGCGIEAEYIATAFIRHATSKIQSQVDLDHIATLGFRGEALASIASVARVEVLTRTPEDEFACNYFTEGGQEVGMKPGARPVGTTVTVRDLFYNTPARMKFLKKDSSEGTFVSETATRLALSHPEVAISFMRENKVQFRTPGDGSLRSSTYAVLGREFSKELLDTDYTSGPYRVSGLITPPKACRASRGMQYFYINGRFVKNGTMMAALENAYKGTVMQGKFPGCVLMLEMPTDLVDVNVHPAKTEVRFAYDKDVFDAVYRAVKLALAAPGSGENQFSFDHVDTPAKEAAPQQPAPAEPVIPTAEAIHEAVREDAEGHTGLSAVLPAEAKVIAAEEPVVQAQPVFGNKLTMHSPAPTLDTIYGVKPEAQGFGSLNENILDIMVEDEPEPARPAAPVQPAVQQPAPAEEPASEEVQAEPEEIIEAPAPAAPQPKPQQMTLVPEPEIEPLQYIGEAFKTYIITQRGKELCIIDKHAAHERILFERLARDYGHVSSQMLLAPVAVNLSAEEKIAILQNQKLLSDAGVEAEDFGGSTVLVRSVPADVGVEDVEDLIVELAAKLVHGSKDAYSEHTEWVLHSIACRAAIKAGDKNAPQQLMHLAEDILAGKVPPFCPHGRPVVLKLTQKELEKQFGRIV